MSVEFHATSVSNMDTDDSNIGYSKFFGDGNNFRHSVFAWRSSPYRVATICLGLLCVLLLAGVIGQTLYHQKVTQENQNNINSLGKEKEELSMSLKTAQKAKADLVVQQRELQENAEMLRRRIEHIDVNNQLLLDDSNKLKATQSELQASNKELTKDVEQLRTGKSHIETNYNVLSVKKDDLQKKYDLVVKNRDELQVGHDVVTRERDNLQNKFNNVTRSREKLQTSYNNLIREVEHLQDRYNASTSEKDKMSSGHDHVLAQNEILKENLNTLKNATDTLRQNYALLAREKKQLEDQCNNVRAERKMLEVKLSNLTAERDDLQAQVITMNNSIQAKRCQSGWQKFGGSCFYLSSGKKAWKQSRDYCLTKGADLAIIKTQTEMNFVNSLFNSDKEVWIGLSDDGVEGEWKWVDGTPMTQQFWGPGQPNSFSGREQDCVEFWHRSSGSGEWNDENCSLEQNWLCQV